MEKKINKTKNKITVSRIRTTYNIKGIQLKIYQFYLLHLNMMTRDWTICITN